MPEMKEVTPEKYKASLDAHKNDVCVLELRGWQVPVLHGLIALAAGHPGVKSLGWPTKVTIERVRDWCRKIFAVWKFTPEEVEFLDKMRDQLGKTNTQS